MRKLIITLLIVAAGVAPALTASAQPFDGERGPASEKIEQLRHMKMIDALDLTEDQSVRLFAREKEHRKAQHELAKKRDEAIQNLDKLIKDNASDDQLLAGIDKVAAIGRQMQANREAYVRGLKDILSVKQIAQMVVFDQKFIKEIRTLLQSLRQRRGPPPMQR